MKTLPCGKLSYISASCGVLEDCDRREASANFIFNALMSFTGQVCYGFVVNPTGGRSYKRRTWICPAIHAGLPATGAVICKLFNSLRSIATVVEEMRRKRDAEVRSLYSLRCD